MGTGEGVVDGEDIIRIPCTEVFLIDDTDTFTFDRIVGIDYLSLGKRIKKNRERSGITQLALADQTGLVRSYIGQIESGLKNASLETIVAIANCLGVSVEELLKDSVDVLKIAATPSEADCILLDCSPGEERILTKNMKDLRETIRPYNTK